MLKILRHGSSRAAVERSAGQLDPAHNLRGNALSGGHANNALPQMAQANVNCRIEPGHSLEEIRLTLEKVVADRKIRQSKCSSARTTTVLMDHGSDRHSYVPPAPRKEVFDALWTKSWRKMWPGIPVLPNMSTGASDGVYTNAAGMPTYCVSGEQYDRDDIRAHGKDERIGVESFARGVDFYYPFLKGVTAE
jgi:acetylornithine deacetylase/succinyl-diaminopimelate desuccinylase-like protein